MKTLNQIIPAALLPKTPTEKTLPELTPEEVKTAIRNERERRAKKMHCSPESISLSTEAVQKVLLFAREHKLSSQKTSAYWQIVDQPVVFQKPTAEQIYEQFLKNASALIKRKFEIDVFNDALIKSLCLYFAADPQVENYDMSLDKGLLLAGGTGSGKTTIMKAFRQNPLQSFKLINCRTVGYNFSADGFPSLIAYSHPETIPVNIYGQTNLGICFDDLGTDEERKHYGDKVNPFTDILLNRYDSLHFNKTHITTNLNARMIESVYGTRVRSRLREMFNLVTFNKNAPDKRK